jgi:2-desacetyl-2-hydroxyethyl bacteriochlorophyllide A dehydrogenase
VAEDAEHRGAADAERRGAEDAERKGEQGTARAFWTIAPGVGEIRGETLPQPGANDVVVRALYSGISRGTESLVFQGRVPASEYQRMRAPFQAGELPGPVKYGYASVGTVERGPHGLEGRVVFVLFPHQSRFVVPAADVHVLPPDVKAARAVLAANMETAVNGVWDADPNPADRVTVIGAGAVGCLVAHVAKRTVGCEVELVDIDPAREAIARALGVRYATPDHATGGATVVIHASGSPAGLERALAIAAFEAVIVEMSWYGCQPVTLPLGEAFHAQRLTIRSSQVGHVARPKRAQYDRRARMQVALSLLDDSTLDVLITGESPFDELPLLMPRLAAGPGGTICHRIRY